MAVSGMLTRNVTVTTDATPAVVGAIAKDAQVGEFCPTAGTVKGVAPTDQAPEVAITLVSAPLESLPAANG